MSILKELPELVAEGIITSDTANSIEQYYKKKSSSAPHRMMAVFGILGAVLVGLGIILILAHNWDELSRTTKTVFAFLPLVIGQLLCAYTLLRKTDSQIWRESSSAFLFFAVGASISLVSQIYHIPGNLGSFLLTWMLLALPMVYVMQSGMVSLFYIVGITTHACETGYWSPNELQALLYWPLLGAIAPYYRQLIKKRPNSNFLRFHNWFIPLSLTIVLGTVAQSDEEWMLIAYMSLFSLFYLIGEKDFFTGQKLRNNGYKIIGSLGSITLLLSRSFESFWVTMRKEEIISESFKSPEFIAAVLVTLLALWQLYLLQKKKGWRGIKPMAYVFLLLIPTYFLGYGSSALAPVLINLFVLAFGLFNAREGARQDHLGILNYGLLIITALVTCRFFDTGLSFVLRGILFIGVGIAFFVTNQWILKKRRSNG